MKRLILLILFALTLPIGAKAYEYEPLVQEDVEWGYVTHQLILDENKKPYPKYWYYRIKIKGDEGVNGNQYKRVYRYDSCTFGGDDTVLLGWIREENKQVFFLRNPELDFKKFIGYDASPVIEYIGDGKETMIYDFSLSNIGAEFIMYMGRIVTVQAIREINVLGKKKKEIVFRDLMYSTIIEGWGGTDLLFGDLVFPYTLLSTCMNCVSTELNYYKNKDGVFEYTSPQGMSVDQCLGSVSAIQEDKIVITQKDGLLCIDSMKDYTFCMIELVNTSGQCVLKKMTDNLNNFQIPLAGHSRGVYILQITTNKGTQSTKIIY